MVQFVLWYFVVSLLGVVIFPMVYQLLPGLRDRGYPLSRAAALLVWGYSYWLLGSLGALPNSVGGVLFCAVLVVVLGWMITINQPLQKVKDWIRENRKLVFSTELLFLSSFAAMAFIRAANPEIVGTEKPMELAFINAIMRSPGFPPNDPWLAGYGISYYYFGYVLVSMLAMATGTAGSVAFNLGLALVFALGALGTFSLVFNLVSKVPATQQTAEGVKIGMGLLGPLFTLLVSNLGGFLEWLHANGVFWRTTAEGVLTSRFWTWLNIENLESPPTVPITGEVTRFWWWWRSSRVVEDFTYSGGPMEVIDEFPFFSFLLGDLHPHVLAIPFALLAMALVINFYFSDGARGITLDGRRYPITLTQFGTAALVLGGLAFLNTWDFPIYVALYVGVFTLRQIKEAGIRWERLWEFLGLGVALGISGVVLYLPFYTGFASQAGGILPNLINPTRGAHLWVMFGTLFIPIGWVLWYLTRGQKADWRMGGLLSGGLALVLWVISLALAAGIAFSSAGEQALAAMGAPDIGSVLSLGFARRLSGIGGLLTLVILLGWVLSILVHNIRNSTSLMETSHPLILLFILVGAGLVIAPEFVYLRDLFGTRMNTVFKFYYQAWLLWSVAAAAGTGILLVGLRGWAGRLHAAVIIGVLVVGLTYPLLSLPTKTNRFNPPAGFTLDGAAAGMTLNADDRAGVDFLSSRPVGTIVEAVGGSYTTGGRVSVHTGFPTVLGWPFHEQQWRGGVEEMGARQQDIEMLYQTNSWEVARAIIIQYGIEYVYIGPLERTTYRVNEIKFREHLPVVFEAGNVVIFRSH